MEEAFVEGGSWALETVSKFLADPSNLNRTEDHVLENMDKGEGLTYIDLSEKEIEAFLPRSVVETRDVATMQAIRAKVLRGLSENLLKGEQHLNKAKERQGTIKRTIGALKFVMPASLSSATIFFPVLGGAVAASAVAWEIKKVLDGIKQIKDDIDRLTTSDYKTALLLFKDILITLANNVYPTLTDVKTAYVKAIDGYHKLDEKKIEGRFELIKIQLFCIVYMNCYDEKSCSIMPYEKVSEDHKNIIREMFNERLKDLQHLSEINQLEYYSENCFTDNGNLKYQKLVDAMDHVKKTSYSNIIIRDTIYQANYFAVKVWSLKSFMVPEGEDDALFSSLNILNPNLVSLDEEITIQASIFKDKGGNWFLKVHLPSEDDYADLSVICKFQAEYEEPAIFLPCKIDSISWKVDTCFLSSPDGKISFYMFKPGCAKINLPLEVDTNENLESFGQKQIELMKDGFESSRAILENKTYSVVTVMGFMNLSSTTIHITPPALISGCPSKTHPWPKELPPLKLVNLVARKVNFSTKGSVGATLLKLSPVLHILFYWSTPFDHTFYENSFGVGCYVGDNLDYCGNILEIISSLPAQPPNGVKFQHHQAKDGPVCMDLTNDWSISVKMTTDYKAVIDILLYNGQNNG